ncbi:MAG: AAA family ATPase [Candidatus Bilamarchaeaceae archaeon]
MNDEVFGKALFESERKINEVARYTKKRYLYDKISSVPPEYFAGFYGIRGIGKSVMLLQLARETKNPFYFSADAPYLRDESIYDVAKGAIARGYKNIFIDEIHTKTYWEQDLKALYDEGEGRVIFSGSSALEIKKKGSELSRRALLFYMKPASFREYVAIKHDLELPVLSIKQLEDYEKRKKLTLGYSHVATYLSEYFNYGGLLYATEKEFFYNSIQNVIDKIVYTDLAYLREISIKIADDIFGLLYFISLSSPSETNYSKLANSVNISKPTVINAINDLAKIGIVKQIFSCGKGASIRKEPKLYLAFPFRAYFNSMKSRQPDIGAFREEFFVNHVDNVCYVKTERGAKTPDFKIDDKVFEVGGAGKTLKQKADYLVKDAVLIEKKTIPLFLFGLCY